MEDFVDNTVIYRLFRCQEEIPFSIPLNYLDGLPRRFGKEIIKRSFQTHNLVRHNFDVCSLSFRAAKGLMHVNRGVGKGEPLTRSRL